MNSQNHIRWLAGMVAVGLVTSSQATIVETQPFSIGLGAFSSTGAAVNWNTNETSAANTYPTGNVTLTYAVNSPVFSSAGPTFPNRLLANQGGAGQNTSGYNKETGEPDWGATLTAAYTGPALPAGSTIRIQIDSISLYGLGFSNLSFNGVVGATADMGFSETTSNHTATSSSVNLIITNTVSLASNFTQLVWDPADFSQDFAGATRTFALSTDGDNPTVDGFEISGTIFVETIPEPSVLLLGVAGAWMMVVKRRRDLRTPAP